MRSTATFLRTKITLAQSLNRLCFIGYFVGEPGRTRTCNPLLNPEMLCSSFFKHFLASHIMVFDGVRRGFVPKVVPAKLTHDDVAGNRPAEIFLTRSWQAPSIGESHGRP